MSGEADDPIDVEPETIIAEETKSKKTKNIDEMGSDELVHKEIELQRSKSQVGRYSYGEAKELATIQRRLYGTPKVNLPKKPQTPFEYSRKMERYTPSFGANVRSRDRRVGMEQLGKTHYESIKRFDRNPNRQHRLKMKLKNVVEEEPQTKKKKRKRRRKKKKMSKEE